MEQRYEKILLVKVVALSELHWANLFQLKKSTASKVNRAFCAIFLKLTSVC